jgi:hypothetical protein
MRSRGDRDRRKQFSKIGDRRPFYNTSDGTKTSERSEYRFVRRLLLYLYIRKFKAE